MAKIIFGAQAIIGVGELSTMGCTPITNLLITTLGGLIWTNVTKMATGIMVNQMRLPLNLQKLLFRSLPSMTNFAMHFALSLVYPLKQSIKSGKTPRETSRSKSRVEQYFDTSNILLPFITPVLNDLTFYPQYSTQLSRLSSRSWTPQLMQLNTLSKICPAN
jgi:hypothetical protein